MMNDDTALQEVDRIVTEAAQASETWSQTPDAERADTLRKVADALDAAADELVPIAQEETHLAEGRLRGELRRTTFQLRLFGEVLDEGSWRDVRIDHADPDWPMGAPRPDLRRQLEPLGPVLVFAAGNFPFAFSVAGGDTASALAAGNAVVVKAHPGHPRLSAATTDIVTAALMSAGAPDGLFSLIYGTEAGISALEHPQIAAGAFTGSIAGGRALFDIAQRRDVPIPFFGELGSVNPTFVTVSAAQSRSDEIAAQFVASVTGSAGQLCTKPGLLIVPEGSAVVDRLAEADLPAAAPLLSERIQSGYVRSLTERSEHPGVHELAVAPDALASPPAPTLLQTDIREFLADPSRLAQEVFGPAALVVTYVHESDLLALATGMEGQLTATVQGSPDDAIAPGLLRALSRRSGRVLWNQWPTGVSVTFAQQHGGPYPATTAPGSTSVGTAAIERFVRPVAYQNVPDDLLPESLREGNPLALPRRVDGELTLPGQ